MRRIALFLSLCVSTHLLPASLLDKTHSTPVIVADTAADLLSCSMLMTARDPQTIRATAQMLMVRLVGSPLGTYTRIVKGTWNDAAISSTARGVRVAGEVFNQLHKFSLLQTLNYLKDNAAAVARYNRNNATKQKLTGQAALWLVAGASRWAMHSDGVLAPYKTHAHIAHIGSAMLARYLLIEHFKHVKASIQNIPVAPVQPQEEEAIPAEEGSEDTEDTPAAEEQPAAEEEPQENNDETEAGEDSEEAEPVAEDEHSAGSEQTEEIIFEANAIDLNPRPAEDMSEEEIVKEVARMVAEVQVALQEVYAAYDETEATLQAEQAAALATIDTDLAEQRTALITQTDAEIALLSTTHEAEAETLSEETADAIAEIEARRDAALELIDQEAARLSERVIAEKDAAISAAQEDTAHAIAALEVKLAEKIDSFAIIAQEDQASIVENQDAAKQAASIKADLDSEALNTELDAQIQEATNQLTANIALAQETLEADTSELETSAQEARESATSATDEQLAQAQSQRDGTRDLMREDLADAIEVATGHRPSDEELDGLLSSE